MRQTCKLCTNGFKPFRDESNYEIASLLSAWNICKRCFSQLTRGYKLRVNHNDKCVICGEPKRSTLSKIPVCSTTSLCRNNYYRLINRKETVERALETKDHNSIIHYKIEHLHELGFKITINGMPFESDRRVYQV